jgi:hypothetical protein
MQLPLSYRQPYRLDESHRWLAVMNADASDGRRGDEPQTVGAGSAGPDWTLQNPASVVPSSQGWPIRRLGTLLRIGKHRTPNKAARGPSLAKRTGLKPQHAASRTPSVAYAACAAQAPTVFLCPAKGQVCLHGVGNYRAPVRHIISRRAPAQAGALSVKHSARLPALLPAKAGTAQEHGTHKKAPANRGFFI